MRSYIYLYPIKPRGRGGGGERRNKKKGYPGGSGGLRGLEVRTVKTKANTFKNWIGSPHFRVGWAWLIFSSGLSTPAPSSVQ